MAQADSKYIEVQRENEVLKSNMNLLIKQMKNPNGSIIIQLQARIAELEREARARQLVIEALCAKMKRGTDDEREYE
ncbi:unnamed protein product [Dovyalis caffra]|uniref:Uncharacterized protein n=1 Tax=Dovyalis caffra TaxID=77055 RepID=A0AAV1RIR4_9ROSI|nr:unnamed protein product [Dovyalis caffra]